MHNRYYSCEYSPKISKEAVYVLRRLAWAKGMPMTKTLNDLILNAVNKISIKKICKTCKGTKDQCSSCFVREGVPPYQSTNTPSKA